MSAADPQPQATAGPGATITPWPHLPLDAWEETYHTLHMWMQIVGKIRLACSPLVNHWWQVPFYVTPRGLTTSSMPYHHRDFTIEFDLFDHQLRIDDSLGQRRHLTMGPRSVADFYAELMATLREMNLAVDIWPMPVEVADPIRFDQDHHHAAYDRVWVERLLWILLEVDRVFNLFRGRFVGKCSPVHFFWGAFDLAVTRFSGKMNLHPPEDRIMHEAYSHQVISHGFWPGGTWPTGGRIDNPVFYAYAVPEPDGFRTAAVRPAAASYSQTLGEYLLPYEAVRDAADPEQMILEFMQSTYDTGADLGQWDRQTLERPG